VVLAFVVFASKHYRDSATQKISTELRSYEDATRPLLDLFGAIPAVEFGPLALKAVREKFIEAGWCRTRINRQVGRVRRIFKWAAGEELVPPTIHQSLACLPGLQRGRTSARESDPVQAVADDVVDATLPYLSRVVRGMVQFQRLTGCRPGEVCGLTRSQIDTSGAVWVYRPTHHKTAWRGKAKAIPIGPRAQKLLEEFPTARPEDAVFSPKAAVVEFHAERTANRKSPRYPSHMKRNATKRKKPLGEDQAAAYNTQAYEHAISRAIRIANAAGCRNPEYGPALPQIPHWAPNQLRHRFATEARRLFGIEAASTVLGHSQLSVTEMYAERDLARALEVAGKIG
jgi:integrase